MKIKKISVFILIVLSIILMFLFVSCEKKNDSPINSSPDEQTQKTEDLTLSVVSADMIFGDELNIICFYGGGNSVEWVSSDKSVAVVDDDGTVNAVGVGSCDITALRYYRESRECFSVVQSNRFHGGLSSGTQSSAHFRRRVKFAGR